MTKSQRLQIKCSEARSRLNAAIEKRNVVKDDERPDAELINEMDVATKALGSLEIEYRAAVMQETDEAEQAMRDSPDTERRERDRLVERASVVPYLIEAAAGRDADGESHEARTALLGDDARQGLIPIEMLEMRQDAVTPVAEAATADGSQASVLERVFSRSIAARLLVDMPMVPVGSANFPVMLTSTTAAMKPADAAQDAGAGSFTGFTLDPVRLTGRYLFRIEDVYKLRGFENVLRRDLAAVMSDAMDDQIVSGDGTSRNVSGFLSELEAPDNPGAVTTWVQYVANFTGLVDGLNAYELSDVRSVIGSASFVYAETLYRTNQSDMSAQAYMRERTGSVSVSSRITAPINNIQTNIAALTSYPGRNAVAPIWRAVEVIRDNITQAASGQIALTAIMLWNFMIVRETGFALFKVRTA